MRILVTGGFGFIGRHCVDYLLTHGHDVVVMDRHQKVKPEHWKGVELIHGDIRDREVVMEAVYKCDAVMNLAGILGTMETVNNPHPSIDTNIHGALNVMEACVPCSMFPEGIRGLQIAVGNHWMNNTYSISKTTAERFALMFNKERGTKITVVRILNAYGRYQKHKPVRKITPNFIVKALNKEPIMIYGDGEQVMDMIYVEDTAKILCESVIQEHGCYSEVMEGGTGRRTSVNYIANMINDIAGNDAGVEHIPMRAGELSNSVVLGDPSTLAPIGMCGADLKQLERGLEETIDWYRRAYSY
jgi:UDP-glucose 4-epimerase